jgi:hypothetical protein
MARELTLRDVEWKLNDQVIFKVNEIGQLTITQKLQYMGANRSDINERAIVLSKADALAVVKFITTEEENLPIPKGVA